MNLYEIDEEGGSRIVRSTPPWVLEVCSAAVENYRRNGFVRPWTCYLAETVRAVVGTCGFKAPPAGDEVEIVFTTFPDFEGEGFANEMARQLIAIARHARPGIVVTSRTLRGENPSTSVLRHFGFEPRGVVIDPEDGEMLEWVLPPATPHPEVDAT